MTNSTRQYWNFCTYTLVVLVEELERALAHPDLDPRNRQPHEEKLAVARKVLASRGY